MQIKIDFIMTSSQVARTLMGSIMIIISTRYGRACLFDSPSPASCYWGRVHTMRSEAAKQPGHLTSIASYRKVLASVHWRRK